MYIFGHTYLAVLYGLVLLLALLYRDTRQAAFLRGHALLFLGAMSYSIYLFHPLIICALFNIRSRAEQWTNWQDGSTLALAFFTTILFCWFLRRLELCFINYGHQYTYKKDEMM
jgi:peptidoglycan/LPS O-acetylase OafA/YrhL